MPGFRSYNHLDDIVAFSISRRRQLILHLLTDSDLKVLLRFCHEFRSIVLQQLDADTVLNKLRISIATRLYQSVVQSWVACLSINLQLASIWVQSCKHTCRRAIHEDHLGVLWQSVTSQLAGKVIHQSV